jgi:hypothetical protein
LSDDAAPEGCHWRDLGLTVEGDVLQELLIKLVDFKLEAFLIDLSLFPIFGYLYQLNTILFAKVLWKSFM